MPDTIESQSLNLHTPRSPVSISTEFGRRGSSKGDQPGKSSGSPAPNSPTIRLTRKRAASLNADNANDPRIGDLALDSASSGGFSSSDLAREQVCLCQPEPKIPRPRNAFILYRQHYQAQVVAQNPGLANPEISKIIGEQWREQAPETKSDWKRLAEEEKQRHQRQYPGYRYQPRRAGKPNGARPVSAATADDPGRCPKCSGRYISTPSTPLTPFTPAFGAAQFPRNERLLPAFAPSVVSPRSSLSSQLDRPRFPLQMQNTRMDSPRNAPPQQQTHRRTPYPPQPLQALRETDEDMDLLSPSPESKRRRFVSDPTRGYSASASPASYSAPQPYSLNVLPVSTSVYRTQPLPGQSGMRVRQGNMAPPLPSLSPRLQQTPRTQYTARSSTYDESLRLPPLQTQLASSAPSTQRADPSSETRESQARSVEAMVMTIPYVNKIKILTKISPPLAPSGPTSPARDLRGAVIAVESADRALLEEIGDFIHEHLMKDISVTIKTWAASIAPSSYGCPATTDAETADGVHSSSSSRRPSRNTTDPFVDYLNIIAEWHHKSTEIIKHITTNPNHPPEDQASSASYPKTLPVALIPRGFSLTTSDKFALRIPINDSYAPVDHWQWMATLWRGIVGPDLTVYAKRVDKDEMDRCGGVEIRDDCAGIIVRVLDSGNIDEKTARRLGFEVLEFVRSMDSGFGRH